MNYKHVLTSDVDNLNLIQYMKKIINESDQKGTCIDLETDDGFRIRIEVQKNE